jgi:hypothetical protein
MHDDRFADDYPSDDAQFYDGLEDHPGSPYQTIYDAPLSGGFASEVLGRKPRQPAPERTPLVEVPEDAPAWDKPLLTPEEFMRKHMGKG